jgi:hypothetical protein
MAHAEDLIDYDRIPTDNQDFNYKNYFILGENIGACRLQFNKH